MQHQHQHQSQPQQRQSQQLNAATAPRSEPRLGHPVALSDGRGRAAFCTVVGEQRDIETLLTQWDEIFAAMAISGVTAPRLIPLSPLARDRSLDVLRVAVVEHPLGLARAVADALETQADRVGIPDLTIDEGFYLDPARRSETAAKRWLAINWNTMHLDELSGSPTGQLPPTRPGKIALVDTGDEGAAVQYGFELTGSALEPAFDLDGHGTSIGGLMRLVAPHVAVDSFRVMQRNEEQVHSGLLLGALTEVTAAHSGYSVIAVAQSAHIAEVEKNRQHVLERMLGRNPHPPSIVAAAGNKFPRDTLEMGYPATAPRVLVAAGLEWSGKVAQYNCTPPHGKKVRIAYALGGEPEDGVGTITLPDGNDEILYGSSYATALIAATLAR
ncbi:S8/S53 family peptidase [Streptomyces sp. Agncl-13]|uniref:S8/S53 family peptidase n=1 Tax=Streptomyces sp. Agncl-13 TaxID=3400628 RepID=UPI003A857D69